MPIITRLAAGKRDPTRVNVFLDHKFAFTLSADEVIKHQLHPHQNLEDKQVQELQELGTQEKLFGKILNFLSYRPRSRREVEDRLKQYLRDHAAPHSVIDSTLRRLTRLGYLDDLKFAAWFVESRRTSRPRSTRHLRSELMGKGIARDVIDQVLSEHADEAIALRALITKHSHKPPDKLVAFLARRGFPYSLIKQTLSDII